MEKEDLKKAKEKREKVSSRSVILTQSGEEYALTPEVADVQNDPLLKSFALRELGELEAEKKSPPHIDIMRHHELVDYEPSADIGHFRFYPNGALIKNLLEDLAEDIAINKLGATRIETPVLFRTEKKDIAEQAASFHERDYRIALDDRQLLLRFAGDFGLFSMMKDSRATYKHLPIRIYEISPSFRLEQSGECSGLKRLRAFTMPDIHCFCGDLESALEEYAKLYKFYDHILNEAQLPFAVAFRTIEDFWENKKQYLVDRLKDSKKDGLIEILKEMKHYWNLKHEFNYIDSSGDGVQLSTVQLDVSDSERYGLSYIAEDDTRKPFTIVHSSVGSIERIIGAILEERGKEIQRGEKPTLPYWLAPTQLRLIPLNDQYVEFCERLANELSKVRTDVDDRAEKVGKKVRYAEREWVPAYTVIGEKEATSGLYDLRTRGRELKDKQGEYDLNRLKRILDESQGKRPFRKSYLPRRVSRQLKFKSNY